MFKKEHYRVRSFIRKKFIQAKGKKKKIHSIRKIINHFPFAKLAGNEAKFVSILMAHTKATLSPYEAPTKWVNSRS